MTVTADFLAYFMATPAIPAHVAAKMAEYDVKEPHRISRKRACWYAHTYYNEQAETYFRSVCRRALLACARHNGRHLAEHRGMPVINRLGKASTLRLAFWAQDRGTEI